MNKLTASFSKGLSRVKQNLEERKSVTTIGGRSGKPSDLSDDLQEVEANVNATKAVYEQLVKRAEDLLHGTKMERDKRMKKMPIVKMAQSMKEAVTQLGDDTLMGSILLECGTTHDNIGTILADYEENVEEKAISPMQAMLKSEIRLVSDSRKNLARSRGELEAIRAKLQKASDEKLEEEHAAIKEEYDILLGIYEDRLAEFASRDADHVAPLIDYMEALANYHKLASELLQASVAKLRTKRAHAASPTVFGKPLVEHLAAVDRKIPHVVEACILEIRRRGMTSEGIFRLSGNSNTVKKLRGAFNSEQAKIDFATDPEWESVEINTVAGVLKLYFRELPEPLLTYDLYRDWINAGSLRVHDDKLNAVRDLVARLPIQNAETLCHLMSFLNELSKNADVTKMHTSNLSIVFGPTLLWAREMDEMSSIMETGPQSAVVEAMIAYYDWIFEDVNAKLAAAGKNFVASPRAQPTSTHGASSTHGSSSSSVVASAAPEAPKPAPRPSNPNRKSVAIPANAAPLVDFSSDDSASSSSSSSAAASTAGTTANLISFNSPSSSPPLSSNTSAASLLEYQNPLAAPASVPAPASAGTYLPPGAALTPFAAAIKGPGTAASSPQPSTAAPAGGPPKRPPAPARPKDPPAPTAFSSSAISPPASATSTPASESAPQVSSGSSDLLIQLDDAASAASVPARPKPKPRPLSTFGIQLEGGANVSAAPVAASAPATHTAPEAASEKSAPPPRPRRPLAPSLSTDVSLSSSPASSPGSPSVMPDGTPIPAPPPRRSVKRTDSDLAKLL